MVVFLVLLPNYLKCHSEMNLGLILWENYIPVHSHSAQELIESASAGLPEWIDVSLDHPTSVAMHAKRFA